MPVSTPAAEPEITELEVIEPDRVDGVKSAASGFPFLMLKSLPDEAEPVAKDMDGDEGCGCCDRCMAGAEKSVSEFPPLTDDERAEAVAIVKAVNAQGEVDEAPDIANAEHVLTLLGKLVQAEAAELAIGNWDESYDIQLLSEAISCMKMFLCMEQRGMDMEKSVAEDAVYKRKVSADERKQLASEGKALPDGSYPIANAEDLHNAAILARSGHGDVAAAKRLIAKRARELGVSNPLEHDASKASDGSPEGDVPSDVSKQLDDLRKAHGEAIKAVEDERDAVKAELAKLKATPIPGGPVITSPDSYRNAQETEQRLIKAAQYEKAAARVDDRDLAKWYRDEAKRLRGDNG